MLADLRYFVLADTGWWVGTGLFIAGIVLLTAAVTALAVYAVRHRGDVQLGPDPVMPPAPDAHPVPISSPMPPPNYHRSGEYPVVVPCIPGATPEAGPVCPICGGPFHPVCPSAPKERTEEPSEIQVATEPELSPVKAADLAPQFAALGRFFTAVDEAREDTDQAMHRIVDTLAGRTDSCPLTAQELPPLLDAPEYDAAIRNTHTRELSEVMKKVSAP